MMLVILGPDGSGKTTLIRELESALGSSFNCFKYYHSRFQIHPKFGSHETCAVTDPHSKNPYPLAISILKACYLFFIYVFGYWANIKDIRDQNTLLLFDRYYYDFMIDPLRFRYKGPLQFIRAIGKIIPEPDLVILLEAPIDILLSRKQELPAEELQRQCQSYRELVAALPNGHITDAAKPIKSVVKDVSEIILNNLK